MRNVQVSRQAATRFGLMAPRPAPTPRMGPPTPIGRVAHWNSSEFFLEGNAPGQYTTAVITSRVMRPGCRTLCRFGQRVRALAPMRNKLRRYYGRGDLHFLTFSCFQRRPLLGTAGARNLFVKILGEVRVRHKFLLVGYVVMPEHVHLLISEPKQVTPSKVLQILKQRVSRALRGKRRRGSKAQLRLSFPGAEPGLRRFWQRRFYDFNVWSTQKKKEKLEYRHANPVQRKLVKHPRDWPWSSWSSYEV